MAKIRTATIVKAAEQAYTPVKTDYSGYVKGMAAINKLIIDRVGLANEQETKLMDYEQEDFAGINSTILNDSNVTFLTDIRTQMAQDSQVMKTSAGFSKKHKQASKRWNDNLLLLQQLKKDATTFTSFVKKIKQDKQFLSEYQGPLDQNFLAHAVLNPDLVNGSVTFTKEGMRVMGPDGTLISMEDLPSGTTLKDGAAISEAIEVGINNIEVYNSQGAYDSNKEAKIKHDLDMFLKAQTSNTIGSGIFDYDYATKDGIVSYIDVLFKQNADLETDYNNAIAESMSKDPGLEWEGYIGPIDTEGEKASLRKKLIRGLDDFSLEKMKDGFVKWIHDEVFANAANVASTAYKKKITRERKSIVPSKEQIEHRKATQGIDLLSGEFITKTENGSMLGGGDIVISGTALKGITDLNFGTDKTFRMKADGTLQIETSKEIDEETVYSWRDAGVQADSENQHHRDGYNKIVRYIKDRVTDIELEEAEHYFADFGKLRDDVGANDRYIQVGEWYSEKVTHTGGNYINSGAPSSWFRDPSDYIWQGVSSNDDVEVIPKVMSWITSMGFKVIKTSNCGHIVNTDKTFYICDDSSYKNSFKLWTPDGKEGRYLTNLAWDDQANGNAVRLDAVINNWYRREFPKLKVKAAAIEDPNEPGTSLDKTQFKGKDI